jgi:hypothetical protein
MSRMRVAAATCLVASGLFVGSACGAVAFAGPDESNGADGAGGTGDSASDTSSGATGADPGRTDGTHPRRPGEHPQPPRVTVGNGRDSTPPKAGPGATADNPSKQSETAGSGPSGTPSPSAGEPQTSTDPGSGSDIDDPDDPDNPDDPDDPDDCDQEGKHCLPWWWPKPGATKSGNGNGGLGSAAPRPPTVKPVRPPVMQLPTPAPNGVPALPAIVLPPPALPVIEPPAPPAVAGGSGGTLPPSVLPPSALPPPEPPVRVASPPPPPHPPAQAVDRAVVSASYRAGYGDYLRTADTPHVVAVAVPGVTGMMLLTAAGGIIGYRQARSALTVSSRRSARFTS